jgi:purine-binding chemotaxis protein CheW
MSKPTKPVLDHENALTQYMNDMLAGALEVVISDDPSIQEKLNQPNKVVIEQDASRDWKENPFQVLLFDVQGLKLALPLHELNGIFRYPESKLPRLPGKPTHFLGLYRHLDYTAQIVDTGHVVLPAEFQHDAAPPNYIILIDDYKWGLSANDIIAVTTLSPDEVKWRKQLGNRPWLAGTVLSQMCSILNVEMLTKQLT